jgi:hypothetical protein
VRLSDPQAFIRIEAVSAAEVARKYMISEQRKGGPASSRGGRRAATGDPSREADRLPTRGRRRVDPIAREIFTKTGASGTGAATRPLQIGPIRAPNAQRTQFQCSASGNAANQAQRCIARALRGQSLQCPHGGISGRRRTAMPTARRQITEQECPADKPKPARRRPGRPRRVV